MIYATLQPLYVYIYICWCAFVCNLFSIYIYVYMCMYICMYMCVCVLCVLCVCNMFSIYMYICMYICVCMCCVCVVCVCVVCVCCVCVVFVCVLYMCCVCVLCVYMCVLCVCCVCMCVVCVLYVLCVVCVSMCMCCVLCVCVVLCVSERELEKVKRMVTILKSVLDATSPAMEWTYKDTQWIKFLIHLNSTDILYCVRFFTLFHLILSVKCHCSGGCPDHLKKCVTCDLGFQGPYCEKGS